MEEAAAVVVEETKAAKQESVSSESESEEEAEYHPNVPVSISHTQIPEENEDEEEPEKNEVKAVEQDTTAPEAASHPAEVDQAAQATGRLEGEHGTAATEAKETTEDGKDGEPEMEESTADPKMAPDDASNRVTQHEETVTGLAEEEEEPKMNGESIVLEAELRPQVICCSEVKSWLGRLWSFPGLWSLLPAVKAQFSFLLTTVPVFLSCLRNLSPMYILTLAFTNAQTRKVIKGWRLP